MDKRSAAVLVVGSALLAGADAVQLTQTNFDAATLGKTVFLKFFAPWCGHCKSMAADWDRLAADFERHPVALIGEIDCTGDGADLCGQFNVEGFPTVLWGDVDSTEAYEGGRDYASMKAFADEFVTKPACSVTQLGACSEAERAAFAAVETQTDQQLLDTAQRVAELERTEEEEFEATMDRLEEEEDRTIAAHDARVAAIKSEHNMKLVAQVLKKRGIDIPEVGEDGEDAFNDFINGNDSDDDDDDDDNMSEGEL